MKMSALLVSLGALRTCVGFVHPCRYQHAKSFQRFATSNALDIESGVSRMETLKSLLSRHGAPGSEGCAEKNDLEPVVVTPRSADSETPELISSIMREDEFSNLHPHLYPLVKSKKTGNLVCALRRAYADDNTAYETSSNAPWPIVEAQLGGRGMRLLALNSEHLMRRIVCECDFSGEDTDLITAYNNGLGKKKIKDAALDVPYELGSVGKLGYGVDKYVLLRVGPFPDIYEQLATDHSKKGDESSALISAEASNNKIQGFASTFLFYARLLRSFPNREEEARDAARMCLRLPLPSIGMSTEEFREVALLGQIADESDSIEEVFAKLQGMYEKMRKHEQDDDPRTAASKTPEQTAIDEANYLLDTVSLTGGNWADVRPKLAAIYNSVGRTDMAAFVNPANE